MIDLIFLTGLSGVGKSTLAQRAAQQVEFTYLSAGSLIASALGASQSTGRDQLRDGSVLDNQALLVASFRQATKCLDGPIVLDGHVIVRNAHGLLTVPEEIFEELGCRHFLVATNDTVQIAANRACDVTREREVQTPTQIREDQAAMLTRVNLIATHLRCPATEVSLVNYDVAVKTFESVVLNPRRPFAEQR